MNGEPSECRNVERVDSPFLRFVDPFTFGCVPVVQSQLSAPELLGILVDEVPPSGEGDAPEDGPFKGVEPAEEVALESPGGLPPGQADAGDDENSELDVEGECPA